MALTTQRRRLNGFDYFGFDGWDNLKITKLEVEKQAKRWRDGSQKHGGKTTSQAWDVVAKAAQELARLKSADDNGIAKCFTCIRPKPTKWNGGMEGGHWIKRGCLPTKTLQQNIRPQCHTCNQHKGGEEGWFAHKLGERLARRIFSLKPYSVDWSFEQISKRLLVIRYRIQKQKERVRCSDE